MQSGLTTPELMANRQCWGRQYIYLSFNKSPYSFCCFVFLRIATTICSTNCFGSWDRCICVVIVFVFVFVLDFVLLCILVNCNDNLSHQLLWQLRSLRQNALALLLRSLGLTLDLLTQLMLGVKVITLDLLSQLTWGKSFKLDLYYRYFQEVM